MRRFGAAAEAPSSLSSGYGGGGGVLPPSPKSRKQRIPVYAIVASVVLLLWLASMVVVHDADPAAETGDAAAPGYGAACLAV